MRARQTLLGFGVQVDDDKSLDMGASRQIDQDDITNVRVVDMANRVDGISAHRVEQGLPVVVLSLIHI